MNKTRVLIVDDSAHARAAMESILSEEPLFDIVATASSGEEALVLTEEWMPDLILMDIRMPGMDGLETTRAIKQRYPYVIIVMVTVSDDVTHLFEALKQGAQGYLFKNLSSSTWLEYLKAVVSDEAPVNPELAYRILQEFPKTKKRDDGSTPLTTREREILNWVASGRTNREIADRLGISDQTVKNHLKNILQKLQLENRVQLTRYALEQGWIERDFQN
ncbi:response regulator transcription factor [Paenibacillus urinalis]|uniref:Response regulator transcription factor n=1 Tax=Paenibacillus urinalis TaxID=521520 RepID=A0AAX3N1F2_9BACL|nr:MULTISPECIES: response regulator transcription factor [Paenibacillus]WDH82974.1 response regulator transcription factor [Paenibacillus urinalis]WDH99027.1 response regulator transcription factor [Paenibacillus urinalis]WDI02720.1 response regulator transcription factor [Paenibacillus urinalis]GAK40202.1 two-component system response regulator [Paenibacillus sp. TCA20]